MGSFLLHNNCTVNFWKLYLFRYFLSLSITDTHSLIYRCVTTSFSSCHLNSMKMNSEQWVVRPNHGVWSKDLTQNLKGASGPSVNPPTVHWRHQKRSQWEGGCQEAIHNERKQGEKADLDREQNRRQKLSGSWVFDPAFRGYFVFVILSVTLWRVLQVLQFYSLGFSSFYVS